MNFDIPRNMILPVERIDVRLDADPHPYEMENGDAIEANWLREKAANPALFDGTVVLLSELIHRERQLEGRCHAVRFATFMHWRGNRAEPRAEHAYAHAMLVSRDNALVAIRMGGHTVNAGSVYFAAGSFEPADFRDGRVDVHFNMAREVMEETGLDIGAARRDEHHHALSLDSGTVIFRRYFLDRDADELAEKISAFVAADKEPEIEGPVVIRDPENLPPGMKPHMFGLVEWHFAQAE